MEIGMIGLGKMGGNMVRRLVRGGHRVVVFAPRQEVVQAMAAEGAVGATSLEDLVAKLAPPRVVWLMVPSGDATENTVRRVTALLAAGDVVVDGGNSNYKDSVRRAKDAAGLGLHFVDCGTSGGVWGLAEGYCLMVGGEVQAVERVRPALETLAEAPDRGWARMGRWTVVEAIELGCSIPVISMALTSRFRSREEEPFSDKLLAALRNQFGGHAVRKAEGQTP
ncbi:MAG: NAD(P)-binding domain-containing protein [Chloroflexi bacterium]|nr:NAD(P)-binding domain-containing protein [Chloroflexota bacterium]